MYVEIADSDLIPTLNEEEATHVKIVDIAKNLPLPVTVGKVYELQLRKYSEAASIPEETYIVDDNGNENHSFWICCKKEFYKIK